MNPSLFCQSYYSKSAREYFQIERCAGFGCLSWVVPDILSVSEIPLWSEFARGGIVPQSTNCCSGLARRARSIIDAFPWLVTCVCSLTTCVRLKLFRTSVRALCKGWDVLQKLTLKSPIITKLENSDGLSCCKILWSLQKTLLGLLGGHSEWSWVVEPW